MSCQYCKTFRTCISRVKRFEHESIRKARLALREPDNFLRGSCSARIMHVRIVQPELSTALALLVTPSSSYFALNIVVVGKCGGFTWPASSLRAEPVVVSGTANAVVGIDRRRWGNVALCMAEYASAPGFAVPLGARLSGTSSVATNDSATHN